MDRIRVILSSHKKELTFVNEGVIIYNTFNDSFLLVKKKYSTYYSRVMEGKYSLGLLPFMIKDFLPSERLILRKCVEGYSFKDKNNIVPDLINRLIKDKYIILGCLDKFEKEHTSEWELPSYIHEYNSLEKWSRELDYVIEDKDITWSSTDKIKTKSIDLDNNITIIEYIIKVVHLDILNDNIKWLRHLKEVGQTELEMNVKKSIKISMNNIINVNPTKVDMGKYIKEYIGRGSYSLLETGQTIIIVNDVVGKCIDLQFKVINLSKIYGQKFHHYYLVYGDKKDLVILIH